MDIAISGLNKKFCINIYIKDSLFLL